MKDADKIVGLEAARRVMLFHAACNEAAVNVKLSRSETSNDDEIVGNLDFASIRNEAAYKQLIQLIPN